MEKSAQALRAFLPCFEKEDRPDLCDGRVETVRLMQKLVGFRPHRKKKRRSYEQTVHINDAECRNANTKRWCPKSAGCHSANGVCTSGAKRRCCAGATVASRCWREAVSQQESTCMGRVH